MCWECLIALRCVVRALQKKRKVDGPRISDLPATIRLSFCRPQVKKRCRENQRLHQRSRLHKCVNKLYKTKVELPESQSEEFCALIEAIAGSADRQKELSKGREGREQGQ